VPRAVAFAARHERDVAVGIDRELLVKCTVHHARRCLEICQANGIADWDIAAAYEACARAARLAGDADGLARYRALCAEAVGRIADPEDRAIIAADLATLS
jgi:hypothetical protein